MFYYLKKILTKALVVYTVLTVLMLFFAWTGSAIAVEIDESIRTVPLNDAGEQTTLSLEQFARGQGVFNNSCAQCHIDGGSKTNPDVDLSTQTLAKATPARNSVDSIIDYMNNPTTYDGLRSLAELHPSVLNVDIFPRMRNLSEEDLRAIAGYILIEPKIVGDQWGGGKPER
ncbi:MAG: photosystem II cytochrome c-550 [Phormidesmis sp.]